MVSCDALVALDGDGPTFALDNKVLTYRSCAIPEKSLHLCESWIVRISRQQIMEKVVQRAFENSRWTNVFWQWQLSTCRWTSIDLDGDAWIDSIGARIHFERIKLLLKLALFAFELGTHVLACSYKLDCQREVGGLVRIWEHSRLDVGITKRFSASFHLEEPVADFGCIFETLLAQLVFVHRVVPGVIAT